MASRNSMRTKTHYLKKGKFCSSGSSGVIQLLVRSMISPVAPHAAFCPIRVFIPSMNSKQPM